MVLVSVPIKWFIGYSTLPMLRLLSLKAHGCEDTWKPFEPCHVGIHWIALAEYSQMSINMPGFHSVQHNHLPHCKLQWNLAKSCNHASRTRSLCFWQSSQYNSPLFNRVAGQVEVPAGQVNFRGSLPCSASNVLEPAVRIQVLRS